VFRVKIACKLLEARVKQRLLYFRLYLYVSPPAGEEYRLDLMIKFLDECGEVAVASVAQVLLGDIQKRILLLRDPQFVRALVNLSDLLNETLQLFHSCGETQRLRRKRHLTAEQNFFSG
jgi:hypothetical protein